MAVDRGKKKIGRPTEYNAEIAAEMCAMIATHPMGYEQIYQKYPHLPCQQTLLNWLYKFPEFVGQYLQAKAIQAHVLGEKALKVANRDEYEDDDSLLKINRDKLKIDTYKHQMALLNSKVYGQGNRVDQLEQVNNVLREEAKQMKEQLAAKHEKEY